MDQSSAIQDWSSPTEQATGSVKASRRSDSVPRIGKGSLDGLPTSAAVQKLANPPFHICGAVGLSHQRTLVT